MTYSLPHSLRQALEDSISEEVPFYLLKESAEIISSRYRREQGNDFQIQNVTEAFAYIVARLPATYAVNKRVLSEIVRLFPDFEPKSMLDMGAGPGTASIAASHLFKNLRHQDLVEPNLSLRQSGQKMLSGDITHPNWIWSNLDDFQPERPYDLVILSYVLNEIQGDIILKLEKLWEVCEGVLVIIEPGTPAGSSLVQKARKWSQTLLQDYIIAPCPHSGLCPLDNQDKGWCHFSVRVARSRLHKLLKNGDAGFEDEKFSYLVLSREKAKRPDFRLTGHPSGDKVRELQVCGLGGLETLRLSKSHPFYKASRKLEWGDGVTINTDITKEMT